MASETYIISEDSAGAITVSLDQIVINSIPGGIQGNLVDLIPQRTFTHIGSAKYFTCDNGTEHGYYFTETNQYVAPHISGVRLPLYRPTTQAHVQARNDSLSWLVPASGERSSITFYDTDPGALAVGVAAPSVVATNIVSPNGWVANQTQDSQGSSTTVGTGLLTAGGYDSNTADGLYLPARTPNVWLPLSWNALANTQVNTTLYTAPAGEYWRLMYLEIEADAVGQALPVASGQAIFYGIIDTGATVFSIHTLPVVGGNVAYMPPIVYPGAGIKSKVSGGSLALQIYNLYTFTLTVRVNIGLYVGP